jgi:hypothetical protein
VNSRPPDRPRAAGRASAAPASPSPVAWLRRGWGMPRPREMSPPPPPAASRQRSGPASRRHAACVPAPNGLPGPGGPGATLRRPAPVTPAYSEHPYRGPMAQGPAYPGPKYPGHARTALGTREPHAALHHLRRPLPPPGLYTRPPGITTPPGTTTPSGITTPSAPLARRRRYSIGATSPSAALPRRRHYLMGATAPLGH